MVAPPRGAYKRRERRNYGMLARPAKSNLDAARKTAMTLSKYFDRVAIALSTICIVHCLAMPFLIALLPVAAFAFGGDGHFHAFMLWFVVPTSVLGFSLGFRVHGLMDSAALGIIAIATLSAAALWGHTAWDPTLEVVVSVAASMLLAVAHWRNFRAVRRVHRH